MLPDPRPASRYRFVIYGLLVAASTCSLFFAALYLPETGPGRVGAQPSGRPGARSVQGAEGGG